MVTITFWIVICGVAGGVTNALAEHTRGSAIDWGTSWLRVAQGVLAAGTVPLFLSLIGNGTVAKILQPGSKPQDALEATYVLIGFCLVASLFSKTYLEGLGTKVMQLRKEVEKSKEKIDAVEAAVVEPPQTIAPALQRTELPNEAQKLLHALKSGPYRIRSTDGLLKTLSSPDWSEKLQPQLKVLEKEGLVRSVPTKFGKGWTLTPEGHNLD